MIRSRWTVATALLVAAGAWYWAKSRRRIRCNSQRDFSEQLGAIVDKFTLENKSEMRSLAQVLIGLGATPFIPDLRSATSIATTISGLLRSEISTSSKILLVQSLLCISKSNETAGTVAHTCGQLLTAMDRDNSELVVAVLQVLASVIRFGVTWPEVALYCTQALQHSSSSVRCAAALCLADSNSVFVSGLLVAEVAAALHQMLLTSSDTERLAGLQAIACLSRWSFDFCLAVGHNESANVMCALMSKKSLSVACMTAFVYLASADAAVAMLVAALALKNLTAPALGLRQSSARTIMSCFRHVECRNELLSHELPLLLSALSHPSRAESGAAVLFELAMQYGTEPDVSAILVKSESHRVALSVLHRPDCTLAAAALIGCCAAEPLGRTADTIATVPVLLQSLAGAPTADERSVFVSALANLSLSEKAVDCVVDENGVPLFIACLAQEDRTATAASTTGGAVRAPTTNFFIRPELRLVLADCLPAFVACVLRNLARKQSSAAAIATAGGARVLMRLLSSSGVTTRCFAAAAIANITVFSPAFCDETISAEVIPILLRMLYASDQECGCAIQAVMNCCMSHRGVVQLVNMDGISVLVHCLQSEIDDVAACAAGALANAAKLEPSCLSKARAAGALEILFELLDDQLGTRLRTAAAHCLVNLAADDENQRIIDELFNSHHGADKS